MKKYSLNINDLIEKDESLITYLRMVDNINIPEIDETKLLNELKNGNENVKKILVLSNLKLVFNIAKYYFDSGVPNLDIIQEGNFGLIKAIENYNYNKKNKFVTYATYFIKNYIERYIIKYQTAFSVTNKSIKNYGRYLKAKNVYFTIYGVLPNNETIAELMNLPLNEIELFTRLESSDLTIESLHMVDKDTKLIDLISSNTCLQEKPLIKEDMLKEVPALLYKSELDNRQRYIIIHRYGLFGNEMETYKSIGDKIGLSIERVRQIEKAALKKLRKYKKIKTYAEYLHDEAETQPMLKLNKDNL